MNERSQLGRAIAFRNADALCRTFATARSRVPPHDSIAPRGAQRRGNTASDDGAIAHSFRAGEIREFSDRAVQILNSAGNQSFEQRRQ
jgi:hypothetical protein